MLKIVLISLVFSFEYILCHVALTFPPARSYAFDYLDTFTFSGRGPCGEPETSGAFKTSLIAGSAINITWHQSFVHQGGFKIELLSNCPNCNFRTLTPGQGYLSTNEPLKQFFTVTLPNEPCDNCTIRLIRQGAEYGSSYKFWSCADVSIKRQSCPNNQPAISFLNSLIRVQTIDESLRRSFIQQRERLILNSRCMCYEGKCQNGGTCDNSNGKCQCQRLFSGNRCQYMDECWTNEDCSNHGQCIDTRSTTHPVLQCYCERGWFGTYCEKVSQVVAIPNYSFNPSYMSRVLRPGQAELHWAYVNNYQEIEVVLKVHTRSWVGIGWKPQRTNSSCKIMDPVLEVEEKRVQELISLRQKQINFTSNQPSPLPDPENEWQNQCNAAGRKRRNVRRKRQYRLIYSGMDCSDIVVGSVKGAGYRIRDMWTRECSKPLPDTYFGGTDDITAAFGQQDNQFTTIVFRKKTSADHFTDHSPEPERQMVIWARGQPAVIPYYASRERYCTKTNSPFYRFDELKYHAGGNRGRTFMSFTRPARPLSSQSTTTRAETSTTAATAANSCRMSGQLKKPNNCMTTEENFNCEIMVDWTLNNDDITFTVKGIVSRDQYIAIGISNDLRMPDTDVYTTFVRNNGAEVINMWASGYSRPQPDNPQNINSISGSYYNNTMTIEFTRPRASSRRTDLGFSATECRHIAYAIGRMQNGQIFYHINRRGFLTSNKVCIPSCNQ